MFEFLSSLPWDAIYTTGRTYSFILFTALATITALGMMIGAMRFLYFYFIKTGDMFLFTPRADEVTRKILKEKRLIMDIGIAQVWFASFFLFAGAAIASALWPVAIALLVGLGIPAGVVFLAGYNKRLKEEFIQNLKGDEA